jgi:hypothetical protein
MLCDYYSKYNFVTDIKKEEVLASSKLAESEGTLSLSLKRPGSNPGPWAPERNALPTALLAPILISYLSVLIIIHWYSYCSNKMVKLIQQLLKDRWSSWQSNDEFCRGFNSYHSLSGSVTGKFAPPHTTPNPSGGAHVVWPCSLVQNFLVDL